MKDGLRNSKHQKQFSKKKGHMLLSCSLCVSNYNNYTATAVCCDGISECESSPDHDVSKKSPHIRVNMHSPLYACNVC